MSNPMKYIRDLEAAGFKRNQAEAQVQMVLDALEGDLMTKSEFAVFKEHVDNKFIQVDQRFREMELRLTVRLGMIMVTCTTVGVTIMSWIIKIN